MSFLQAALTVRIVRHALTQCVKRRQDMSDRILNKDEAAAQASISVRTLDRLEEEGEGPPRVRLGKRRIGYWETDLIAWLRARTSPAKQAA